MSLREWKGLGKIKTQVPESNPRESKVDYRRLVLTHPRLPPVVGMDFLDVPLSRAPLRIRLELRACKTNINKIIYDEK